MSYTTLKESDKQRLAAMLVNLKDQKPDKAKVDWSRATLDFDPAGSITGPSFKLSIGRLNRNYSRLSQSDKNRLAACVVNIEEADRKVIMGNVDWNKAATDFQPSGKITAASFRTSIKRMFPSPKSATATGGGGGGGGNAGKTVGKKRRAPAAARSSSSSPTSESTSRHNRKNKKTKVRQTVAEEDDDTVLSTIEGEQGITAEDVRQPDMGSRASSQSRYATPLVKAEDIDDDAYGGEEDRYEFFAE